MGTISDKLMRIINTKEDIRQALISKGYDVPTSIPFKEYAKMISDLPCRVDSFPDIEGIVARYSALGLTNEQMAANPVWVDKTGNGHDLQMKNFAWKEGSGISDVYPGFILGDGVDDFAVTEKELNFEDTYTVYTAFIPFQDDPARNMILCGKNDTKDFSINYSGTHLNFKPSTGVNLAVRIDQFALLVCKRNKDITTIINLSTGESKSLKSVEFISNPGLYYLWRNVFATFHAKAAIAGQIIDNGHFTTDEEDENILNWHKKQYPWLFPDQAWTVTGKTNEDEDRATIANITGNSNDLVLSNFGFVEGSGYNEEGEYAGYLVTDGVDDKVVSAESIAFTDTWTIITDTVFLGKVSVASGILASNIFTVYNYQGSGTIAVTMGEGGSSLRVITSSIKAFSSDGTIYDAEWNEYHVEIGTIRALERLLKIGTSSNETSYFCQLAFKFLGIYNNQILSKDDCIKAYNYLQTLKAK